jgi:hypothetical protein
MGRGELDIGDAVQKLTSSIAARCAKSSHVDAIPDLVMEQAASHQRLQPQILTRAPIFCE